MKSIQNQYNDLKEGKMSQANFMRNLRMTMPQYVTNITSFKDSVRILKNKGLLHESLIDEEIAADKEKDNRYNSLVSTNRGEDKDFAKLSRDEKEKMMYADTDPNIADPINDSDTEFDAILKQLEDEMAGEIAVKSDVLDEPLEEAEGVTADAVAVEKAIEDKKIDLAEVKAAAEKAIKGDSTDLALLMVNAGGLFEGKGKELHPNAIHPGELRMGIRVELEHTDNMDKAKKIALDHLAENPFYYTALKLSGIDSPSAPKVKAPKEVKEKKKKDVAELVDKANQMQKVKMPKAEEKKKLKENVDEKMRFQDLPADPEKYKMVKDSKGKIIKATNADGIEFQRGDEVVAYNGEKIKIASFKEEQGKVMALYNKGMFFASIDIDGLEAGKPEFRPGVDMGKSFEKIKEQLRKIVRQALAENK